MAPKIRRSKNETATAMTCGTFRFSGRRSEQHAQFNSNHRFKSCVKGCSWSIKPSKRSKSECTTSKRCERLVCAAQQGGSRVEFPPYSVVYNGDEFSIRAYEPYTVVRVEYERRDLGYLALGSYFDGQNASKTAFKETQPVIMTYGRQGSAKTMELMVGSPRNGDQLDRPPVPTDPAVKLDVGGAEIVAVMKFEGNIVPSTADQVRKRLMALLDAGGIQVCQEELDGKFRIAQYGALYSLSRINEMMLRVDL